MGYFKNFQGKIFFKKLSFSLFSSLLIILSLLTSPIPINAAPDEMARTSSKQWYIKARDYSRLNKKEQALECLQISLDLNPYNQEAKDLMTSLRGKAKTIQKAPTLAAPKTMPSKEALNFYEQAKKLILKGDYLKARNCLEIALEMDEYNFQVKELLDKVVQKIKFEKFKSQKELFLASEDNKNSSLNRDNQNPFKTYIVKKGDTLGKIAKLEMGSFNKYKDLAKYNKLSINTILKIGQPLKIPLPGHLNTPGSVRPLNTPAPSTGPSNLKARTVQVIEVNNSGKITNQKSKKIVDYSSLTNKKSNNTDNSITSRPVQISPVTPGPEIFYKPLAPEKPVINKKREIFDIKPKSAEDYYNLAQGYWKLGKIENAMENYSKAIKLNPAYLAKGRAKLIDDAILRLEEKSSSDPAAFAKLHLKLADMLQKRGELELAAKELLRAIELDESREEAYFTLGMIYEKLGEKELAINTYEKINEMFASRDEIISLASDRIALLAGGQ